MRIKNNWGLIYCGFLVSLSLCFLMFLYAPTQIYISNAIDFSFNITDVWQYMFPLFILFSLIGTLLLATVIYLNKTVGYLFLLICTGLLVALFIEGNYLASRLPVLDGNEINWKNYSGSNIASITIWCLCFFVPILAFIKKKEQKSLLLIKLINIIGLFFFLSLLILCITNKKALEEKSDATMTADGLLEMSEENNFVVFLLDSIDARSFESVLDAEPSYKEVFRDFTFFSNTLCMYPFTSRSVPYILFGKWNDNSEYYPEYLEKAIDESLFFHRLSDNGFDQRVYSDYLQGISIAKHRFGNFVTAKKLKEPVNFSKMLIELTGFRYLPFALKRFCVLTPENIYFDSIKTSSEDNLDLYSYNNVDLYRKIQDSKIIYVDKKCFRFIYSWGAHAPYIYDKDLNEISDATYEEAIECSIKLAEAYILKLKDAGIYDDTVIVIMADHGINKNNYLGREGRQNPIMLIKGIKERHDYVINDAPVSHADLQSAFVNLLEGKSAYEAFDWREGEIRERTYMLSDSGVFTDLEEYKTVSHASETGLLYPTGRVFHYVGDS